MGSKKGEGGHYLPDNPSVAFDGKCLRAFRGAACHSLPCPRFAALYTREPSGGQGRPPLQKGRWGIGQRHFS